MYLRLLFEIDKAQISTKVIITEFHGLHQTGALWYLRTDGYDETKRRTLQLNESALKTDSSQQFTCDIISTRCYQFVSVMHENCNSSAQHSISSCMLYFLRIF